MHTVRQFSHEPCSKGETYQERLGLPARLHVTVLIEWFKFVTRTSQALTN